MAIFNFIPAVADFLWVLAGSKLIDLALVCLISCMCIACIFYTLRKRQFVLSGIGTALLIGFYMSIFAGGGA